MLFFLIGFMGCGKSYTARNLSSVLNIPYIDTDKFIIEKNNKSIIEIFEYEGEQFFRNEEKLFLKNLPTNQDLIISTGGGLPCFGNNMETMLQMGITIYLNRDKSINMQRLLKGKEKRPLIANMSDFEISEFYDKKLAERDIFYSKSLLKVGNANYDQIAIYIKALQI